MTANSGNGLNKWAFAIVPLFILPGCANNQPVSSGESDSLNIRVARLEEALKSASMTTQTAKEQAEAAKSAATQLESRIASVEPG